MLLSRADTEELAGGEATFAGEERTIPRPERSDVADHVVSARRIIAEGLAKHGRRIALVSSFGADAVSLLHLVASVDRATPVILIDTGRHFPETLAYVDEVEALLGLTDLRRARPTEADVARLDPKAQRASYDPDGCCDFRKVKPLAAALEGFDAWISGRKRFQAATRTSIPPVEEVDGREKYNPLADWTSVDLARYRKANNLPQHPLVAQGFLSIGCAPCTSPVKPGEDPRAGRWRGFGKTECGIHLPGVVHDGAGI